MTDYNQDIYNRPKKDPTWIIIITFTLLVVGIAVLGYHFFWLPSKVKLLTFISEIEINWDDLSTGPSGYVGVKRTGQQNDIKNLVSLGRIEEALEKIEAMENTEEKDRILASISSGYAEIGEYEKSFEIAEMMVELYPNDYYSNNYLGWAYMNLEDYQEAEKYLLKSIELNDSYRLSHNNLCIVYKELKKYELGKEQCLKAIDLVPSDAKAYNNIALIYEDLGEINKAIEYLEQATSMNPPDRNAFSNLGRIYLYYNQHRDIDKAEKNLKKAMEFFPGRDYLYYYLGYLYDHYKNNQELAIDYYLQAINYGYNDYFVYYNLGISYEIVGDYDNAIKYLTKAIEVDPEDKGSAKSFLKTARYCLENYCGTSKIISCQDSDGFDIRIKGKKTEQHEDGGVSYDDEICLAKKPGTTSRSGVDSCQGEDCYVREYWKGRYEQCEEISVACPQGCSDGACPNGYINESIICNDSDDGYEFFVQGSCTGPSISSEEIKTRNDTCINPRPDYNYDLIEYGCSPIGGDGDYSFLRCVGYPYKCPNGCQDGACIK